MKYKNKFIIPNSLVTYLTLSLTNTNIFSLKLYRENQYLSTLKAIAHYILNGKLVLYAVENWLNSIGISVLQLLKYLVKITI